MADDELDRLYWVPPEDFTSERTRLTALAKKRGDTTAAERVSAARKPTTAAWIVNRLALRHKDSTKRLQGLGNRLRAAHADMDGARIRDLSAEQHQLINELTRAAFAAAGIEKPSSTVRDDVTSTLQAAVADPEVSGRLGRLARPEQWTGFGAFGDAAAVQRTTHAGKAKGDRAPSQSVPAKDSARDETERQRRKLTAALAAAERAKSEADQRLSERDAERDAARQRHDDALAALRVAEREVSRAEERYAKATQASRAAAESVKDAKAQLRRL